MSEVSEYFSMQGKVAIGLRNTDGSRQPARWAGDASVLELNQTQDETDITENWSGNRADAATLIKSRKLSVKLTLAQLNDANAALALGGAAIDVASGSASAEAIGDVAAGDMVALDYAKVSALVLTDTADAALVLNTDYTVNTDTGVVTFLTAKTGVKAAYTYAAYSLVTALTGVRQDMYVLFDGMNTVKGTSGRVRGEVYKVQFPPAATLGLIQNDQGQIELTGKAYIDPVRVTDPKYGPYARVIQVAAAA